MRNRPFIAGKTSFGIQSTGRAGGGGPPSITASVSGLTSNPTYGTTAQVGTVLTGTLNNLVGGEVIVHRWRTSAGLIAGANAATYAVALGGNVTDGGNVWYSPTVDAVEVNSVAHTVRHAAPSAAGGLADQNWVENIAISTFDVSADFTALGETYAVQTGTLPTGLSLSSAGLITGTPTEIVADRVIFVRGSNSGGYVDTVFSVTVADVPDRMDPPAVVTTGTTTISVDRAAAPANNNSPIDLYQARWRAAPSGSWTTVSDIADPDTLTGLPSDTLIDVQTRCHNAIGFGSWSLSASDTTDAPTGDAAVDYGALTLAGHGGLALPAGAASITNAGGTNLEVSTGMVVPAAGGGVSSGTVVFNNGTEWTVTALADTYHVTGSDADNAVEFNALKSAVGTGFGGKTVKMRAGSVHGQISLYNVAITGTVNIEADANGVQPVIGQFFTAGNTTNGNIELRNFKCDAGSPTTPYAYSQFEIYNDGGTALIDGVDFEGLFDPVGEGLTNLDYKAKITLNNVSGGTLSIGNYFEGPNGNRNYIIDINDDGGGVFTLWMGDDVGPSYQDSARLIQIGDTLTFYTNSGYGTPTGATCTATSVASSFITDNADFSKNVILVAGASHGRKRVTVQNCTFRKCGRPLGSEVPFDFTDNIIDTYAGDGINGGWAAGTPEACTIRRNFFTNSMFHGSDHTNPHGDVVQTPQGVTANMPDWIIDENVHIMGDIGRQLQVFLFIQINNDVFAENWRISNNLAEGAIVLEKAQNCIVANNTCPGFAASEAQQYLSVGLGTGSGGNIVANNVAQLYITAGNVLSNNITLSPGNYDYCFEETDYSAQTADKAAALIRYTPKSGGDLMGGTGGTGGHADPWVVTDAGAVNSAGTIPSYDAGSLPSAPGTMVAADWEPATSATPSALDVTIISAPTGSITDYEYTTNGGTDWRTLAIAVPSTATITLQSDGASLAASTSYTLSVRAVNGVGAGLASNAESATSNAGSAIDLMPPALGGFTDAALWANYVPITGGELVFDGTNLANSGVITSHSGHKVPVTEAGDYYFDFICSEDTGGVSTTFNFVIYMYDSVGHVATDTCTVVCPAGIGPSNNGALFTVPSGVEELELVVTSVTANHDRKYSQMRLFKV